MLRASSPGASRLHEMVSPGPAINGVMEALETSGLLLVQDKQLPNVVTLVTGETMASSWWSHAKGQLIFAVLSRLEEHPDVLFCKLLREKVTLVHRRLWPAFVTIASRGEAWQTAGLSAAAQELLASVAKSTKPIVSSGPAVKELEKRLLVHAHEIHTESGKHAFAIQSWRAWSRRVHVKPLRSLAAARQEIEQAAERLGANASALPWRKRTATT